MKMFFAGFLLAGLMGLASLGFAQGNEATDSQAEYYFYTCAGCHTVGGGNLSGPDLMNSTQWSKGDLGSAIKNMEKNVGPLSSSDIEQMVEFLKDLSVSERIAKQKERIESSLRAELPPASFETGEKLFRGEKRLLNGGPACMTCHHFVNHGGSLGLDLSLVKNRISGAALQSGIENSNYKIMRSVYAKHVITKEESLHLSEYLSHPESVDSPPGPIVEKIVGWGITGFGAFFVLLWMLNRQRKGCTREKLIQKSMKG